MNHPLRAFLKHSRLSRLWNLYQKSVAEGDIPSFQALGLPGLSRHKWLGFTNTYAPKKSDKTETKVIDKLLELWRNVYGKDVAAMKKDFNASTPQSQEKQVFDLCMALLHATKTARVNEIKELLAAGVPVNFQHPVTKQTALHIAAGCASSGIVDLLANNEQCDFLIHDQYDRIAWDMAHFFNPDPEIEQFLLKKTKEQAKRDSVDLLSEHRLKLSKWAHQDWYYTALNIKYGDDREIYQPIIGGSPR